MSKFLIYRGFYKYQGLWTTSCLHHTILAGKGRSGKDAEAEGKDPPAETYRLVEGQDLEKMRKQKATTRRLMEHDDTAREHVVSSTLTKSSDERRLIHDIVKHVLSMKRVPKTPIHYYDVFLNHRGKDVKNTLASNLYYRLRDHELQVFFDKEEMQKGSRINSVIENAINFSSIHIVILSENYAQSEWCLDELLLMIDSGSIIIPIFYDVKPTDIWWNPVDGRNGVYAEALRILEEEKTFDPETQQEKPRYESHTIEMWKKALMEVTAGREGLKLETYDGDEGKLVDMIVQEVVKYRSKGRRGKKIVRTVSDEHPGEPVSLDSQASLLDVLCAREF